MKSCYYFFLPIIMLSQLDSAWTKCDDCHSYSVLDCYEFNSWNEVNNELSSVHCRSSLIYLKPQAQILFDNEFNHTIIRKNSLLSLFGVIGVNVYPWPTTEYRGFDLVLFMSFIQFYVNNTPSSAANIHAQIFMKNVV
jgi:hypothetical protein